MPCMLDSTPTRTSMQHHRLTKTCARTDNNSNNQEALVNWLALAGWGQAARSPSDSAATVRSPESTAILTLPELIEQVRIEYPTPDTIE